MSVLPGEGTHVILYGSTSFPARARSLPGYLARPDLAGAYPAVVVVPPERVTSSVKDLCRRLARHGLAVVSIDLGGRVLADLESVVDYLRRPGTDWADPHRIGVLGIGAGGEWAVRLAADDPALGALALAYTPLGGAVATIGEVAAPVLGLYGKDDDDATSQVSEAHSRHRRSEWVMYDGVGSGFLDDAGDGYDPAAAKDAIARLVKFFSDRLERQPA